MLGDAQSHAQDSFGEGDGLPGLVVDRYAQALVVQVGTAGLESLREVWWPVLAELARREGLTAFVERSQAGRKEEGLEALRAAARISPELLPQINQMLMTSGMRL